MSESTTKFEGHDIVSCASVSIILEWDNIQEYASERTETLLRILREQCSALRNEYGAFDFCVVYNDRVIGGDRLLTTLSRIVPLNDEVWKIRCIGATGKRYYELKNVGASQATGEWLVFVDNDVLPEDGWLANLLASLKDPEIRWVGGGTYVGTHSWLERVFALIWIFPLRSADGPTYQDTSFWANNFATHANLYREYPFPVESDLYRGSCIRLCQKLLLSGIPIHRNPCARVEHAIPSGLYQMILRALFQGYDSRRKASMPYGPHDLVGLTAAKKFLSAMKRAFQQHREVGLPALSLAGVGLVAAAYFASFALGRVWGEWQPHWFIKRF